MIDLNQYRGAYKWCDEIIRELEETRQKLAVAKRALEKITTQLGENEATEIYALRCNLLANKALSEINEESEK